MLLSSPLVFIKLLMESRSFDLDCWSTQSANALRSSSLASFGKPSMESESEAFLASSCSFFCKRWALIDHEIPHHMLRPQVAGSSCLNACWCPPALSAVSSSTSVAPSASPRLRFLPCPYVLLLILPLVCLMSWRWNVNLPIVYALLWLVASSGSLCTITTDRSADCHVLHAKCRECHRRRLTL